MKISSQQKLNIGKASARCYRPLPKSLQAKLPRRAIAPYLHPCRQSYTLKKIMTGFIIFIAQIFFERLIALFIELCLFYISKPEACQKQYAYVDNKPRATNKTDVHHALRGRKVRPSTKEG